MMNSYRKRSLIQSLATAGLVAISTAVSAGPPFYWWRMNLNISQSECAERAPLAVATEIAVDKIEKSPTGATAWNSNSSIIVYCTSRGGGKSHNVVFVSGFKNKQTKETMLQIRDAMKSGVFE